MKKTNKILAIILAILMVITIIPITASAATYSGTCGDNVTWTYDSSTYTLTISGTGDMYDYKYNNRPWESYEDKIKTVVIDDGVITIGEYAFYDCGKLVTITLPDSLTSIDKAAFYFCQKLQSMNIPDSVTTISEVAFYSCDGLTVIVIPDSVTTIGYGAFEYCEGLEKVTFGNGVTTIGDYAFAHCAKLTSITLPKNVATIGNRTFADCITLTNIMVDKDNQYFVNDEYGVLFNKNKTMLMQYPIGNTRTSYTIPDGVTTIGEMSFYNCASLTSITLPDSIRIIEESAFNSCEGITNLIIPNGVTTIGYGAIRDCTNLKDITIPDSVTSIGDYAITRYSTLIHYGGTEKQWKQLMTNNPEAEYYLKNNMVYCTDKTVLPSGSCGDNLTWTYDIVTGILTISGTGDMYNFDSHPISATDAPWSTYIYVINKIIIDDGVTSIGEYAFYGCSNLSDVIIGDGVTTIGENAFSYCDSLISVTIGNGVTTIKEYAFYECEGLTSVIIPVSVTNMDNDAFYGCPGITDVYYEGTEEQWLGYYVYPEGSLINLNRPFTKSTIHYNYHIHKYDAIITTPTCTEKGYTTYACECGNSYVDDYVNALGHIDNDNNNCCDKCSKYILPTSGTCGDNLTWEFDEYTSTLTISGTGDMYYYDVYFNASNDEADDRPWQAYTSKIKNIIINEGVTTISEKAFYNFEYLFFVTIPLSLTRIKDKAFYSWDGLMAINYLGSEEEWKNINIGHDNSDLFNCEKIYFKDDYVPVSGSGTYGDNLTWTYDASTSTLTFFGTGAMEGFAGDGGIFSEPNFFDGIRPWEDYEFEVKHIVISEGITSIGKNAFAMFINLESVEIPCSITQIGSYSFGYCINLTDVYYSGTENDWNNIIKGDIFPGLNLIGNSYNVQLDNATKHYDYHTHDYKASVTEPTCAEQGYTTYTCECGDSYVADYVDALGHIDNDNNNRCDKCSKYILPTSGTYGDNVTWTFDESTGTLTFSGTGEMQCATSHGVPWHGHINSIESVVISEGVTTIGDKVFYNHKNIKNISIADSVTAIDDEAFYNCTGLTDVVIGKGVTTIGDNAFYECSNLKTVTIYNAVKKIGKYSFSNCSKLTDVYYLGTEAEWNAITKATILSKTGLENATIHFLGEETHECSYNAVVTAPTCTEQGYTTYTCECGDSFVDNYVDALGHDIVIDEAIAPDCVNAGLTEGSHCSRCDDVTIEQEIVPALGHTYDFIVTAPNCTEQGYTTYSCECGDSYVADYVDALGHNHTSVITTPATHTTTGIMTYTCTCGDTYTETIDKLAEHNHEAFVTKPTCTEQGCTTYTCECGDAYIGDYVDATGHIPANAVEENYIAPTCTEQGSKDVVVYCSICDEEISRETEIIDATDHADNDEDGCCDACNEQLEDNNDSQISIISLIVKIIKFLLSFFGIN